MLFLYLTAYSDGSIWLNGPKLKLESFLLTLNRSYWEESRGPGLSKAGGSMKKNFFLESRNLVFSSFCFGDRISVYLCIRTYLNWNLTLISCLDPFFWSLFYLYLQNKEVYKPQSYLPSSSDNNLPFHIFHFYLSSQTIIAIFIYLYWYLSECAHQAFCFLCWWAQSGFQHRPFQISTVIPVSSFYISQLCCSPILSASSLPVLHLQPCCPCFRHIPLLLIRQPFLSSIKSIFLHVPSSSPFHLSPFTQVSSCLPMLSYYLACWFGLSDFAGSSSGHGLNLISGC